MSRTVQRVRPDLTVVKRHNDLFDLWAEFTAEHSGDPNYDPDNDSAFVEQARHIMGLPAFQSAKVEKCLTCGCNHPTDDHGDERHITLADLDAAAQAAHISRRDEALRNLTRTLRRRKSERRRVEKLATATLTKDVDHVPDWYTHGWVPTAVGLAAIARGEVKIDHPKYGRGTVVRATKTRQVVRFDDGTERSFTHAGAHGVGKPGKAAAKTPTKTPRVTPARPTAKRVPPPKKTSRQPKLTAADRAKIPAEDFVDLDGRRFYVREPQDVADAARLGGMRRPAGISKEEFDSRLAAIARRKGPEFEAKLPKRLRQGTPRTTASSMVPTTPVRKSLADARTISELNDTLSQEIHRLSGKNVEVDLEGSDIQVAREHSEGILLALERFPKVDFGYVGSYGPGAKPNPGIRMVATLNHDSAAFTIGSAIYFNNEFAADPDKYRRHLATEWGGGVAESVAKDPREAALHEFGHILTGGGRHEHVLDDLHAQALAAADAEGLPLRLYITKHLSRYASTDPSEYAAEVFADVLLHGDEASDLARAAFASIEDAYRRSMK